MDEKKPTTEAVTAHGPAPGCGHGQTRARLSSRLINEKARVIRNGDGETRPPILPNRFHQACVQKDDLARAEQVYALGAFYR